MQPTNHIAPGLLDNRALFTDPFYDRFTLRTAPQPLTLAPGIEKDYLFPTFYGDVTCAMAIFLCPYNRAAALMPHPRMAPVRLTRGCAAVAFSCYIYNQVLGVPPYNEIAMTIPVLVDPKFSVPLLPLVTPWFKNFGYYVFSMPVTSLENQIRGREIWGLPKVVQAIDIAESGGDCVTTACEEDGTPYFTLRVPMQGKPTDFDVRSNLYTRLGDRLLQSETCFKARFNVAKFPALLRKRAPDPATPFLTLGDSPAARAIRALEIEPHPFQLRFARGMASCFDLPNPDYRAPFAFHGAWQPVA